MDGYPGRRWPKGFGVLAALLLTASLLSFHPFDPTINNLMTPLGGVRNWLGLPGALIGGSLVEWAGAASFLLPLLIVHWCFNRRARPRWRSFAFHSAALLLIAASLHGLLVNSPLPDPSGPGLLGWAAGRWLESTVGSQLGGLLLVAGLAYALTKIAYPVYWGKRAWEAWMFTRYALTVGRRRGAALPAEGLRASVGLAGAAGHGAHRIVWACAQSLRSLRRAVGGALMNTWRTPLPSLSASLGGRRGSLRSAAAGSRFASSGKLPAAAVERADGFDSWFSGGKPIEPLDGVDGDRAPPVGGTEEEIGLDPAAPSGPVRDWAEAFRNYEENLDLDWEEKVLKSRRVRRPGPDWKEDDDSQEEAG